MKTYAVIVELKFNVDAESEADVLGRAIEHVEGIIEDGQLDDHLTFWEDPQSANQELFDINERGG